MRTGLPRGASRPTRTSSRPPVLPAVPRLQARARAERRDRRRRRLRRGVLGLLALVPLGLLAWLLLASPVLAVRTVEVRGNDRLSAFQVVQAVGVEVGTPLARVDTSGVRSRVGGLAPVAEVEVHRSWPGTLSVRVVERLPVAGAPATNGRFTLVDATGTAFDTVGALPDGLPRLQVPASGPAPSDPSTVAALDVLVGLPAALRDRTTAVRADSPTTVTLSLTGGRTVVWGEAGEGDRKAPVVAALLRRKGRTIDVTSPDVAVVRSGE